MSCYFRHMNEIFAEAGIEITPANRKQIDQAIHRIVEVDYKDCPAAWKAVKQGTATPEQRQEFVRKLKAVAG
ncbi:MAG: hypothetical protein JXA46_05725 [Dehalococcoidales bacterium]|nr:hypothetical protein [Dehalococcoidales bacterium]